MPSSTQSAPFKAAAMPDVQQIADTREIEIQRVGVKGLRHPIRVLNRDGAAIATVAEVCMTVALPKERKGTHMSRFVELLNEHEAAFDFKAFAALLRAMTARLGAERGHIEMRFPYFIAKQAPVSGVRSLMDYEVSLIGEFAGGETRIHMRLLVPVTSLCPCSKEISDYGAHNQRSHITLESEILAEIGIDELIALLESEASAQLYGVLKRPDEKFVTEQAYDNPKFVEDMIRDLARVLDRHPAIGRYRLEVENFEAIHNHSAYAMIER